MQQADLRRHLEGPGALPRATTLLREIGLRTVLFHIKAGETLPEHNVSGAIAVLCLRGNCTFIAGADQVEMSPYVLVSLSPRLPHSLVASEDTLLLAAIADPSKLASNS